LNIPERKLIEEKEKPLKNNPDLQKPEIRDPRK
jgi:hypothetical protein